jgi:hypothetical protein
LYCAPRSSYRVSITPVGHTILLACQEDGDKNAGTEQWKSNRVHEKGRGRISLVRNILASRMLHPLKIKLFEMEHSGGRAAQMPHSPLIWRWPTSGRPPPVPRRPSGCSATSADCLPCGWPRSCRAFVAGRAVTVTEGREGGTQEKLMTGNKKKPLRVTSKGCRKQN